MRVRLISRLKTNATNFYLSVGLASHAFRALDIPCTGNSVPCCRQRFLGRFDEEEDAIAAVDEAKGTTQSEEEEEEAAKSTGTSKTSASASRGKRPSQKEKKEAHAKRAKLLAKYAHFWHHAGGKK